MIARLVPERYHRTGKRVIAHMLNHQRRKRAAAGIDQAELDERDAALARQIEKEFKPIERLARGVIKREAGRQAKKRLAAISTARTELDRVINDQGAASGSVALSRRKSRPQVIQDHGLLGLREVGRAKDDPAAATVTTSRTKSLAANCGY